MSEDHTSRGSGTGSLSHEGQCSDGTTQVVQLGTREDRKLVEESACGQPDVLGKHSRIPPCRAYDFDSPKSREEEAREAYKKANFWKVTQGKTEE